MRHVHISMMCLLSIVMADLLTIHFEEAVSSLTIMLLSHGRINTYTESETPTISHKQSGGILDGDAYEAPYLSSTVVGIITTLFSSTMKWPERYATTFSFYDDAPKIMRTIMVKSRCQLVCVTT